MSENKIKSAFLEPWLLDEERVRVPERALAISRYFTKSLIEHSEYPAMGATLNREDWILVSEILFQYAKRRGAEV